MNERIKKVRDEFCDGNNKLFAETLGVSPQYASSITKKGKNVGDKVLSGILEKFPSLNPVWLKMGVGAMLKGEPVESAPLTDTILIPRTVWEFLSEQLKIKDDQLKTKDEQLKARDKQIEDLIVAMRLAGNRAGVDSRSPVAREAARG
jgi:hypothetical protein